MRVAIIGRTGQLAQCLREERPPGAQATYFDRSQIDLADLGRSGDGSGHSGLSGLAAAGPHVVINAAAYTAVDKAEAERQAAFAANSHGPAALASFCASLGVPLIHMSTDYIFDGASPAPYREDDPPSPLGVYGQSKLAGEKAVLAAAPRSLVLRTSWVYSAYGSNFVKTMLRLGRRRSLGVVADQRGCPTSAHDLARAIWGLAPTILSWPEAAPWGVYHFAGEGACTWAEFARAIFAEAIPHSEDRPEIVEITSEDYGAPASRPKNSVLECSKFMRTFGASMRPWPAALSEVVGLILRRQN
jgi:dTDP-4-dehydrorhamnose reductase